MVRICFFSPLPINLLLFKPALQIGLTYVFLPAPSNGCPMDCPTLLRDLHRWMVKVVVPRSLDVFGTHTQDGETSSQNVRS